MNNNTIRQALALYTQKFPDRACDLTDLHTLIDTCPDITCRSEFRGHVTASALLFNPLRQALLIHHNLLGRWLQPGGHIDPTDGSPQAGALRELIEETGIDAGQVTPMAGWEETPIWLDRHWIPPNPRKAEPRHEHWDLLYLFETRAAPASTRLTPQLLEISSIGWRPMADLPANITRALKLAGL
jgi:8-oxo-dGTP pyrophosphatase MutT (NUDIX family)